LIARLLLVFSDELDDVMPKLIPDATHPRAVIGCLAGNINANLAPGLNGLLVKRGWITSSADNVEEVGRQIAKKRFGHLRPARIPGAWKQNLRLDHGYLSPTCKG
jgi:hypothetical protein